MKKVVKAVLAGLLAASCVLPLSAKSARDAMKPTKNWNLYIPGKNNKKDVAKDLEKSGWLVGDRYKSHLSLADSDIKDRKVLKLDTLDGKNDAMILPLSGKEKKVTLIFVAQGAVDPDKTTTPFGVFYAALMNGEYQSVLRHNASNQIKGSKGSSRLTSDGSSKGEKINIVSDWHEYRMIFDIPSPDAMTAKILIDGVQRHSDICKKVDFSDRANKKVIFNEPSPEEASNYLTGAGNYLLFGENDGSTNGFGRYSFLLVVLDDDVETVPLADLEKKFKKTDLQTVPVCTKDPGPKSKRPDVKPAGVNMLGAEIKKPDTFVDPSAIENGTIDLAKLPYSKAAAQKVNASPAVPALNFAAKVGANEQYKTIAAAIEAVPEGSAILIQPGLYQEKLVIRKPGITLVGTSPVNTIIYGYEADTGGIDGNILVEVNYLPAGTVTEPGKAAAIPASPAANAYFNAVNLTFYNKGAEWNKQWGGSERRSITLGLKGVDKAYIENCLFLGQQDTTYFRSGRAYFKNCYFEGEVDFFCGGATAVMDNCHIYNLKHTDSTYMCAAAAADTGYTSTAAFANGHVFLNCLISADEKQQKSPDGKRIALGRGTWAGGSATSETATGKCVYINTEFDTVINSAKAWADWDITNTVDKAFFRVYKATGKGAETLKALPQLTAEEAKLYSNPEKILGFKPELIK